MLRWLPSWLGLKRPASAVTGVLWLGKILIDFISFLERKRKATCGARAVHALLQLWRDSAGNGIEMICRWASELDLHRGRVGQFVFCPVSLLTWKYLRHSRQQQQQQQQIKMVLCFNSCARWAANSVAGDLILTWHLCSDKQDQRGNLVKKPIIQQVLLKLLLPSGNQMAMFARPTAVYRITHRDTHKGRGWHRRVCWLSALAATKKVLDLMQIVPAASSCRPRTLRWASQ